MTSQIRILPIMYLIRLKSYTNREESLFVKTQKIVDIRQASGKEYRYHTVCVVDLSRGCESGSNNNADSNAIMGATRQRFWVKRTKVD